MSEKMTRIPYDRLLDRVCHEYETHGTIFGVSHIWKAGDKHLPIFGSEKLETPFGPAAGPNTQLAQNIIAAYAAGARFFELKTVQIMDGEELAACVNRPCILAEDEGYNCEWSTELEVPQAMEEYIKAWKVLKVISRKYGLGSPDGFVFNMSVGYTLEGVKSPKLTAFLDGMKEAGVSHSVTISTLHGCPPEEIEQIANYLIGERRLNTYVKCNPTLLGYDFCRRTLDSLGYTYIAFDDRHFREDLQWGDAVPMFLRLRALAKTREVEFGLKLTNTFPVDVKAGELPSEEMYMSGRALFPLTAELAARVAREFSGKLRVSYSGGADYNSIAALFRAGIWPVTMATNLLRPGGYNRMKQLADLLYGEDYRPFEGVDPEKAAAIAASALTDGWYRKPAKPLPERKIAAKVPLTDCFFAPCREGCPIHQDIPAYVRLTGQGRYLDALRIVTERNPLPNITGSICNHRCMDRCTRQYYEKAVDIRGCKLEAAKAGHEELLHDIRIPPRSGKRAAVIGAGPAGIAAASLLARAGVSVTVFERAARPGGAVDQVIPDFRIDREAIDRDVELAQAWGAMFVFGCEVRSLEELHGFDDVIVCTGAWSPGVLPLEAGEAQNAVNFLGEFKKNPKGVKLGRHVVVVGGGNTAMDAARAAKRVRGVKTVTVVYRRDIRNMPADEAELRYALADGVEFRPLLTPVSLNEHVLRCEIMELGSVDEKGRKIPFSTGRFEELKADAVLAAVGEKPDAELYRALGIPLDGRGRPILDPETGRTELPNVYMAGDGAAGPATVVEAIAGAARAVSAICGGDYEKYAPQNAACPPAEAIERKGVFRTGCHESLRCLECASVCENCVDVCPNRANVPILSAGRIQILHLDGPCNRCGNCETFCPWSSAPYKDKWTLFPDRDSFDDCGNPGFLPLEGLTVRLRFGGAVWEADLGEGNGGLPGELAEFTRTVLLRYPELIE